MPNPLRILYCHCAYAQVVPPEVKAQVLAKLAESGVAFEAVGGFVRVVGQARPGHGASSPPAGR